MPADDLEQLKTRISQQLKYAKVSATTLKATLDAATLLRKGGTVTRVFPEGIVAPDGAGMEVELTAEGLQSLVDLLRKDPDKIRDLKVFPIGIIVPDKFRAVVSLRDS
jgi:hypothetical protein